MEDAEYSIEIHASGQHVWDVMLGEETYDIWVKGFSENSMKEGEWKQGSYMNFLDPGRGGTRALLEVVDEPNRLFAKHVALLTKELEQDTQSEAAKKWIGTTEEYILTETDGMTTLRIVMRYHPDFKEMFDKCWRVCLQKLKELCEE